MPALRQAQRICRASLRWQLLPGKNLWAHHPRDSSIHRLVSVQRGYGSTRANAFFSAPDLTPPDPVQEAEKAILVRARRYGIYDTDRLLVESSVGRAEFAGSTILDRAVAQGDLELWCIYLDFQRLRFGDEGVKSIYRGLRNRCGKSFPFIGPEADYIWDAFIGTSSRELAFLRNVCHFEARSGAPRDGFMVEMIGALLESRNAAWARTTTWTLRGKHQIFRADVLHFFLCACRSECPDALEIFRHIYKMLSPSNLYKEIITHLIRQDRIIDALGMHKYLISVGDLPQDFESIVPFVKRIARTGEDLDSFMDQLSRSGASFEAQARKLYELEKTRLIGYSNENLNIVASSTFGQHKLTMTDEFAARGFATSSLSFELVLNGLRLLGLVTVGPLSVRQIALRAGGPKALSGRFVRLQELGVDTGSSTYVRIVKRLANHGQTTLLAAVLETDQHADVFDDMALQMRLLRNYYSFQDWPQINRTLAILNQGETGRKAEERSSNFLLQSALSLRDWAGVSQIAAKIRRDNQVISLETVQAIRGVLRPREVRFAQMSRGKPDEISFVIALLQDALKSGTYFGPDVWRETIRRLGMLGRWDDLENIVLWVARWYQNVADIALESRTDTRSQEGLRQLFNSRQQGAIIAWAFIFQVKPKDVRLSSQYDSRHEDETELPWVRGIHLLRSLQKYGVLIHHGTVQQALIHRLRILFSVEGTSKLLRNRRLRQQNSTSLLRYLRSFYKAWMKPLGSAEEQHLIRSTLKGRRSRPRDAVFLQLSKKWEMYQQQHAAAAQRLRQRRIRRRSANASHDTQVTPEFVEYRDLFHPSWEEYESQYGREQK